LRQAGAKDVQQLMIEGADHFPLSSSIRKTTRCGTWSLAFWAFNDADASARSFIFCLQCLKSFLFDQEAVAKKKLARRPISFRSARGTSHLS
jgi:hypothetical protein